MGEPPPPQAPQDGANIPAALTQAFTAAILAGVRAVKEEIASKKGRAEWWKEATKEIGVLVLVFGMLEPAFEAFLRKAPEAVPAQVLDRTHTSRFLELVSGWDAIWRIHWAWWVIVGLVSGSLLKVSYSLAAREVKS